MEPPGPAPILREARAGADYDSRRAARLPACPAPPRPPAVRGPGGGGGGGGTGRGEGEAEAEAAVAVRWAEPSRAFSRLRPGEAPGVGELGGECRRGLPGPPR